MRLRSFLAPAFAASLFAAPAAAQTVCDGNYTIDSQSAYEAFDALDCTEVTGDLYVYASSSLTTYSGLAALNSLERVGGSLSLERLWNITDLSFLGNLQSVGNSLDLLVLNDLASLSGASNLESVGGLGVSNLPLLESLDGLTGLREITANPGLDPRGRANDALYIGRNNVLSDITELADVSLSTDEENVVIVGNSELTSLDGVQGITRVGDLRLIQNGFDAPALAALSGLEAVSGILDLASFDELTDLAAFAGLETLGGFSARSTPNLSDISVIGPLLGGLRVLQLDRTNVADLSLLAALPSTLEVLAVYDNPSLTSLAGLEGVTNVTGYFFLGALPEVSDLSPLANLEEGGYLEIYELDALTDFSAFPNLTSLTALGLYANPNLESLAGLEEVGGAFQDLYLEANPNLTDIDVLSGVTSVSRSFYVADNAALADCSCGLYNALTADTTPSYLYLENNAAGCSSVAEVIEGYDAGSCAVGGPALSGSLAYGTCPASLPVGRFACRVDAAGTLAAEAGQRFTVFLRVAETGRVAFRGEVKPGVGQTVEQTVKFRTIDADPAAFTLELVAEAGSVSSPSGAAQVIGSLDFTKGGAGLRADAPLAAYPNPAAGSATLSFAVAEPTEARVVVYDALGREVARPVDGEVEGQVTAALDASALAPGLYVVRLTTDSGRAETVRLSVAR